MTKFIITYNWQIQTRRDGFYVAEVSSTAPDYVMLLGPLPDRATAEKVVDEQKAKIAKLHFERLGQRFHSYIPPARSA